MSEIKHTPGPWRYIDATKVASMQYASACVIKAGDKQITRFSWNDDSPWFPNKEESQSNARLIAAAPDMMAALKDIFGNRDGTGRNPQLMVDAARNAIRKAEGNE